ncbi:MAG: DUF1178 family protein [Burkholderiaceae bacterium]
MLVLNLSCPHEHPFEGWFGSAEDFDSQLARGLISCPSCGETRIERRPNAPRLNVSHLRKPRSAVAVQSQAAAASTPSAPPDAPAGASFSPALAELQAQLQQVVRAVIQQTEDVGERFAEEARRIHYGEAEGRAIRGQASRAEAASLADEGIAVMALPDGLDGLDEPRH